jgi:hypothetical protein
MDNKGLFEGKMFITFIVPAHLPIKAPDLLTQVGSFFMKIRKTMDLQIVLIRPGVTSWPLQVTGKNSFSLLLQ